MIEVPAHIYDGGWEHFVGGGVAVFDCDQGHPARIVRAAGGIKSLADCSGTPRAKAYIIVRGSKLRTSCPLRVLPALILWISTVTAFMDLARLARRCRSVYVKGANLIARSAPFRNDRLPIRATTGPPDSTATWEDGQTLPTLAFGTYVDQIAIPEGPV